MTPQAFSQPSPTPMTTVDSVQVSVPATTANIGPGFDCLGAALTRHNRFCFTRSDRFGITVTGPEADRVGTDARNLAYRAFATFYQKLQLPVPVVQMEIHLGVPLARGLGSSSTAIVGGIVAANVLAGERLDRDALAALATEMEGHPDNVVPALLGGCRLAAAGEGWTLCDIPWHPSIVPVVAIPEFELSTEAARQVLPTDYSRADAIFNTAHLGLLLRALETGNSDWLRAALCDRIHQPYRQTLIPGYTEIRQAALAHGAWGLVISGAGPTLLALVTPDRADRVRQAMVETWQLQGIQAQGAVLAIDRGGTRWEAR